MEQKEERREMSEVKELPDQVLYFPGFLSSEEAASITEQGERADA